MPARTKNSGKINTTWAGAARVGVFAGYVMHIGYRWRKENLAWDIDDFVYANLSKNATRMNQHIRNPHITLRCALTDGEIVFHVGKLTTESIVPSRGRST